MSSRQLPKVTQTFKPFKPVPKVGVEWRESNHYYTYFRFRFKCQDVNRVITLRFNVLTDVHVNATATTC